MASIETIRRVTIEARASGVEQATARLNDATRAIGTMEGAVARARRAYDPLFTATERLAAVSRTAALAVAAGNITQEEANRLYDQAANKLTGYGRELERVTRLEIQARAAREASARAVAQANQQTLNSRFGIVAPGAGRDAAADFQAAANAADNLRARYSPLFAAQRQYLAALTEIKEASRAGILSENERAAALERTKAAFAAQVTGIRGAQGAGRGRLDANGFQNLFYQGSDIIASAASGMSPMTIALQQGGQIAPTFMGPNGASLSGIMKQAGEAAMGLPARIGLVTGALGGLTVGITAAAAAWFSYRSAHQEVRQQLEGIGRASGVSIGQINAVAPGVASGAGISTREAREAMGTYAATGRITSEMYAGLAASARDYSKATGADLSDVLKEQAAAIADPGRGAQTLAEKYGILSDSALTVIKRLDAQGERLAAQRALFDAYRTGVSGATETTTALGRALTATGNAWSDFWTNVGKGADILITGGDLETQMKGAQRALRDSTTRQEYLGGLFPGKTSSDVERAKKVVDEIQAKIDANRRKSDATAANLNSREIGNLLRGLNPDQQRLEEMSTTAEKLRKALSDPIKWGLDLADIYRTNQAVGDLSRKFQAMTEDIDKFGSTAVAAMNRAANLGNRTVGFSPSARSAAEIAGRYDELERTADSRELAGLRRARSVELDTLRRTTYQTTGSYRTNIRDVPDAYRDRIYRAAIGQGLDPSFLASVAAQESGNFNPQVVSGQRRSTAGAIGIMQFMPGTAREYGIDPTNPEQSINAAALYLRRSLDKRNGNEALALADYNAGPGRVNSVGGNISRLPAETQNYIATILTSTPQATELAKAQKARLDGLESERQGLEIANRLLGRNGEAYDAATRAQQMLADAERQGIPITDAFRAQIDKVAGGMAAANRALADTRLGRDLEFEREQLGRSAGDQSAFARARAAYGDTTSNTAQAAIGRIREIDMMKEGRTTFQETFGGVISSLSRGATAASAFSQVFNRLADKFINAGVDGIGGSLFGSLSKVGGGGGGGFGGILSGLFGGGGATAAAGPQLIDGTLWFENGGVMTDRGAMPLRRYAAGGIANSPQLAIFGEGRMNEAYVPLPDGRSIPVTMQGGATGGSSYTNAPVISIDARGSTMSEGQIRGLVVQALAANNQERDRTHFERVEAIRRIGG